LRYSGLERGEKYHSSGKRVKPLVDEVVVVDDCSQDNTATLAGAAGAIVLRHPINRGQGAALQTGNDYALKNKADIIVHLTPTTNS